MGDAAMIGVLKIVILDELLEQITIIRARIILSDNSWRAKIINYVTNMTDPLTRLAHLSEDWYRAQDQLFDVENQMSGPFQIAMENAKTIVDLQNIVDCLPKNCKITRRVYEAMIRMEDEQLAAR